MDQNLDELGYAPPIPTFTASVLEAMTCDQLCSRLRKCGMPGLAKACQEESLDGDFLVSLSDDILMKPPFSMDEFEVNSKLKKIKVGWVPKPSSIASVLEIMTCNELCSRLQTCGMPGLAKACQEESLDGDFLVSLSDDILMKPPFSLDEFEVNTKLKKIKAGWVPK